MAIKEVSRGIYAGVPYIVTNKDGKIYIGLRSLDAATFAAMGANMKLLNDIGDRNPEDVMKDFVETIPNEED